MVIKYVYTVMIITVVISVFMVIKCKKSRIDVITFILAIIIALIGFLLAISNDYLSQFDYNWNRISYYQNQEKYGISFDEMVKEAKNPPKFIFVFDDSKSTKREVSITNKKDRNKIKRQIESVNNNKYNKKADKTFGWSEKNGMIPYNELLRVRLLSMLGDLEGIYNEALDYSIVSFSEKPKLFEPKGNSIGDKLENTFENFLDMEVRGETTDFYRLFKFLNKEYVSAAKIRDKFQSDDCVLVFLSDFLHDVRYNKNDNDRDKDTDKSEIVEFINMMGDADIHLKFLILKESYSFFNSEKLISIEDLLKENLSANAFQEVDIVNDSISTWYPIVLRHPIPFFYSNSVFEDSLETFLVFDGEDQHQEISIHLAEYSDFDKLEYGIQCGDSNKRRLSNRNSVIKVSNGDKVFIRIKGFIPAPYTSPDLVIDGKGVQYIIPVAFFKKFPKIGWPLIVGIFGLSLIMVLWGVFACGKYIKKVFGKLNGNKQVEIGKVVK